MHTIVETVPIGMNVKLARIVKAGRWIFTQSGIRPIEVNDGPERNRGRRDDTVVRVSGVRSQSRELFASLEEQLHGVGASTADLVRLDQYYGAIDSVNPYHLERSSALSIIPPSTSIVVEQLVSPNVAVSLLGLALMNGNGFREPVTPSGLPLPRNTSGFAPAMRAGEFLFVSGQMADAKDGSGIAAEATMSPEWNWDGSEIGRQASYVLDNLLQSVESAGSDLQHIVKAQVYLTSMAYLSEFDDVWRSYFGEEGPARLVAPASKLGLRRGVIEINLVCVTREVEVIRTTTSDNTVGIPSSVTANDLTLLSAVSATSGQHLAPEIAAAREEPYTTSAASVETERIVDEVESTLSRAGKGLTDLTRIVQFHTDLRDFLPSAMVWQRRIGGPVPISAQEVKRPLASEDASIVADCWAVEA